MALAPGSIVGHYRIVGSLGAGGMGEVYRARDTKLGRDVALKFFRTRRADPERRTDSHAKRARSPRSIIPTSRRSTASRTASRPARLIMELVEGEDLAERIAAAPMPVEEALAIARQIAEALQAAHDRGIIHRDLSRPTSSCATTAPSRSRLRARQGARSGSGIGDQGSGDISHSPTITSPAMTLRGVILGTAAYMAPEQAKGRVVDKRADIWAFGCVLYEMLTGRKAFAGEDVSDTLASILKSDVDWTGVPPRATRLLKKCLEKDPRKRLHDIGDAWDLLDDACGSVDPAPSGRRGCRGRSRRSLPSARSAIASLRFFEPPPSPPPSARFQIPPPSK